MSAIERFLSEVATTPQIGKETNWLTTFVKAGFFNVGYLKYLNGIHCQMSGLRDSYLKDVARLKGSLRWDDGLEIYVARIYYTNYQRRVGMGHNIVFSSDDGIDMEEEYGNLCSALGLAEIQMPFNVLLANKYFFEDDLYKRGLKQKGAKGPWEIDTKIEQARKIVREEWTPIFKLEAPETSFELPKLPE